MAVRSWIWVIDRRARSGAPPWRQELAGTAKVSLDSWQKSASARGLAGSMSIP